MLNTFIRKQRSNDCLISNCTPNSSLNYMKWILIYLTWISWTLLDTDMRVERRANCCQASSLRKDIPVFNDFITHVPSQKFADTNPSASMSTFSYTRQLSHCIRDTASFVTRSLEFASLSRFINTTQWPNSQCTSQLYHKYDISPSLALTVPKTSIILRTRITFLDISNCISFPVMVFLITF